MKKLRLFVFKLVRETFATSLTLFKITLPVSALTKLLTDLGATDVIGSTLGALMGLCHSVIEDTLLMGMVGGHWSAILVGRVVVSLLVVVGLRLMFQVVPLTVLKRYVYA